MKIIKAYSFVVIVIIADFIITMHNSEYAPIIFVNTGKLLIQMLAILPPIFILIGLLDVWVPREQFMRYMGKDSGVIGITISILLGAAAAGPLYAAFPLAGIMMNKGVKFTNILIFLGAWSSMKIPLILFEVISLGVNLL